MQYNILLHMENDMSTFNKYDKNNRLVQITDGKLISKITYNGDSNLITSYSDSNGYEMIYTYTGGNMVTCVDNNDFNTRVDLSTI